MRSRAMGSPGTSAAACKTQQEVQLPGNPDDNGLWSMSRTSHSENSDCVVCMAGDHEDYGDDLWEEAPTGSPARGSPGRIQPLLGYDYAGPAGGGATGSQMPVPPRNSPQANGAPRRALNPLRDTEDGDDDEDTTVRKQYCKSPPKPRPVVACALAVLPETPALTPVT